MKTWRDMKKDWKEFQQLDPEAAQALRLQVISDAEAANEPPDTVLWYDDPVEYGSRVPPGLEGMLAKDLLAVRTLDGHWLVQINPSGQVYNPGSHFYRVVDMIVTLDDSTETYGVFFPPVILE